MPIFYRGAGVGTYWHQHDARLTGFMPKSPTVVSSVDRIMQHVARGTISSPYKCPNRRRPAELHAELILRLSWKPL